MELNRALFSASLADLAPNCIMESSRCSANQRNQSEAKEQLLNGIAHLSTTWYHHSKLLHNSNYCGGQIAWCSLGYWVSCQLSCRGFIANNPLFSNEIMRWNKINAMNAYYRVNSIAVSIIIIVSIILRNVDCFLAMRTINTANSIISSSIC